ncbi:alpha/beta fold hydrolase [Solemya pervernicosa gill symbiont]|nr:alpha/beta hydrolase [Solemya pervernicosa gill symbiont]
MTTLIHTIKLPDGRRLEVLEEGPADGRLCIYLHGTPGSARDHLGFEPLYQELGLRMISVNRPGIGKSSFQKGSTAVSFADDLLQLFDQLSIDRADIIGFSAGGLYGCAFAAKYPERIVQLNLFSSVGPYDNPELHAKLSDVIRPLYDTAVHNPAALLEQLSGLTTPEAIIALLQSATSASDHAVLNAEQTRPGFIAASGDVLKQGLEWWVQEIANIASPWGFSPSEVTAKTRLWHGTDDLAVPIESSEYLVAAIPSATANYVEGAGHYFSHAQWPELLRDIA